MIQKLKLFILHIFLCSCFSAYALPKADSPHQHQNNKDISVTNLETQLLNLVNKERKKAGLKLLSLDSVMCEVSRKHSSDMVAKDFFAHKNPKGQTPFDRMRQAGIIYYTAAENIAYAADITEIHKNLMNSPGHRTNILNPKFGKIGIGIIPFKYGLMTTQLFMN